MKMKRSVKIALMGLLTALAFGLGYVEYLLPINIGGIPGIKLGLANLIIMSALYILGLKEAAIISVLRILLSFLLFGNVTTLIYSACGAFFSLTVMFFIKKTGFFGYAGVSVCGAVFHNLGQILAACVLTGSFAIFAYFPVLMISAVVTGTVNGMILKILLPRFEKMLFEKR